MRRDTSRLERMRLVDALCCDFEQAWLAGRPPRIEDVLGDVPDQVRLELLREMVACEIELRARAGESPSLEEYFDRFPGLDNGLGVLSEYTTTIRQSRWDREREGRLPTVPGYKVQEEIGRGGMGVVYKARHVHLNRVVALKMILSGGHAANEERVRFLTEAKAIAEVKHPGIVQIFDFGADDGLPFFSMEFCLGGSLAAYLEGTPLPAGDASRLVEQVARAIQAAHEHGIVHRDLKPANVLLFTSRDLAGDLATHPTTAEVLVPKVTDFGLAKRLGVGPGMTQTGQFIGTPSYVAPEQATGRKEVGPLADVWSLGAILYECLTGRPPFKATTTCDTLNQVIGDEPVPPRRLNAQVPPDLETICLKCLQKDPQRRYTTAVDLAEDLHRWQQGIPISARPAGQLERAFKWARRRPTAAALVAVSLGAVLGLIVLCSVTIWQWRTAVANEREARRLEEMATRAVSTLSPVVDEVLNVTAGAREKHLEVSRTAYEIHEQLMSARPTDTQRQRRLASISWRFARANTHLHRWEDAERLFRRSIELYEGLVLTEPSEPLHRLDLMRSLTLLGPVLHELKQVESCEAVEIRTLDLARETVVLFPRDVRCLDALACYCCDRGKSLLKGRKALVAESLFREALKAALATRQAREPDYHWANQVVAAQNGLGKALDQQGRNEEALQMGQEAQQTLRYLLHHAAESKESDRTPDLVAYQFERGNLDPHQARRLVRAGKFSEAEALLRDFRMATERGRANFPDNANDWLALCDQVARELAAWKGARLARTLDQQGKNKEALEAGMEALVLLKVLQGLLTTDPQDVLAFGLERASTEPPQARRLARAGRFTEAETMLKDSHKAATEFHKNHPALGNQWMKACESVAMEVVALKGSQGH